MNDRRLLTILVCMIALDVYESDAQAQDILPRHEPSLVAVADHPGCRAEEGLAMRAADAFCREFADHFGSGLGMTGTDLYNHPLSDNKLFAVSIGEESPQEYGLRLFLLSATAEKLQPLGISGAMYDSYYLRPSLFIDGPCVIVLGETGAEYTWGVSAWRTCGDHLQHLGNIEVSALPDESSPLPFVTVQRKEGVLQIIFETDLLLWKPDGSHIDLYRRSDIPHTFQLIDDEFVLLNGVVD
jgi:hypothetical protein